ncbi:MAG: response regulator [Thermoanaerobaculia bacterium]
MNRILVVDDEKSITFALRQYFLQEGYVVDCAMSCEDALRLLAGNHYSVAIVDIELRGSGKDSDGLKLAAFIRSQAPRTPVIILTAMETTETQQRAQAAGVQSLLCKPARLSVVADVAFSLIRDNDAATSLLGL